MKYEKSSFYPLDTLEGKQNYQEFYLIKKNGDILKRVLLSIPNDFMREHIICIHFLKRYVQLFIREAVGLNILSRDNPWDFEVEFSNKETFNIEITSIADKESLFRNWKYEDRLISLGGRDKIPLHELKKVQLNFPTDENSKLLKVYEEKQLSNTDLIDNPFIKNQYLFMSSIDEEVVTLESLLTNAINKKISKKHADKEQTILIIDNRTVAFEIEGLIEKTPFKEIWFYTGYFSDLTDNDSAFTLIPIKISDSNYDLIKQTNHEGILIT